MQRLLSIVFFVLTFSLSASFIAQAQDTTSITGIVTDASGASVANVEVTLLDTTTNTAARAKTSSAGSYTISGVRPGPGYKITFEGAGFQTATVLDLALQVGTTRTQNVTLRIGAATTVEVSAKNNVVAIDTTDATIGNNLDAALLNELPVQARDSAAVLFTLQPGFANGSITGARTDQSATTVDGLDANDIVAGQSLRFAIIPSQPVDSIEEFRGTVAGELASNGPGGGGQFQLVTKNGTNHFHGNINEYHRDTSTAANTWFGNNAGVGRAPLIRNQFGGNIGGPVLHDKLFFFFNFLDSRIIQSSSESRTVPLDSFRNGNLSYILNEDANGNVCTGASRANTTPQCIGTLTSAQVAGLDPQKVGFDPSLLAFINQRYPHANDLTGGDGINTGGFRFTTPTPDFETNYTARGDYSLSSKMKLFGRYTDNRRNATQSANQFPGDPTTNPFIDRSYSWVVGHIWSIGLNKINQISYGDTVAKFSFPALYNPTGIDQFTLGGGPTVLDGPYSSGSSQQRRIPVPVLRDDFNWQKGAHNINFGGTFKFIKTDSSLVNDFNFVNVGLGGELTGLNPSLRPTDIRTAGTTSSTTYDNAFSLALGRIGAVSSNYNYNSAGATLPQGNGAIRRYRYFQTELYAGDTWKVTKALTLSYGLRYQVYSVPYEANGNESIQNTNFDQYFASRLAQSASGTAGDSAVPFITYDLGGKANNAAPLYKPSYKDFAPRFAFAYNPTSDPKLVINAGAGIVFDRTVINAINFIQDQSSYLFQNSANTQYGSADANASLLNDPRLGANFAIPAAPVAPAIAKPYTPFVNGGTPYGLANNEFNTIVNPNLKDPYSITYNAGIQQELPGQLIMKLNYVGRLGRRLLAQADASQLVDFNDTASGQLYSSAFGNITQQLRAGADPASLAPQPWFENVVAPGVGVANPATDGNGNIIQAFANNTQFLAYNFATLVNKGDFADFNQGLAADGLINSNVGMASQFAENTFITNKGFSSYNGLLLTLSKNLANGLQFDFNYTWSHSIDNTSLVANSIASSSGVGFICDAARPKECRGNSDFDSAHQINADFLYALPFGRGRTFLPNSSRLLNEAIGGWEVSGIPSWTSGQAYTTASSAYVAGYANNAPAIFLGNKGAVSPHVHKDANGAVQIFKDPTTAASNFTGPVGFTIGSRNNLRGPATTLFDAGLAKTFPLVAERLNLKFRADAYNVMNHPVFGNPNNDITSGSFGQITTTSSNPYYTPRILQLALRLEF